MQTDPGMYQVTQAYLDTLASHGVDGLDYFSYIVMPATTGEWGAMSYLGQPASQTPKFDALVDYASTVAPGISDVVVTNRTATGATITWTTSMPSTSQIDYVAGAETAYGSASLLDSTLDTVHTVQLTGLTPGTTYNFQVVSTRPTGPSATSAGPAFSTDVVLPVLSAVGPTNVQATSVTIAWTTDKPTTGAISYAAAGEATRVATDPVLSTSHSITLAGLAPGTAYQYTVASTDDANNTTSSGPLSVTTAAGAAVDPLGGAQPAPAGSQATAGTPGVVAAQGRYAFVAGTMAPYNLQVFDLGGAAPALLSTVATNAGVPSAIAVEGEYKRVYSVQNIALFIYDVSNPAAPRLASRTNIGVKNTGIVSRGQIRLHLLLFDRPSMLDVYDVSNPAKPALVGSAPLGQASEDFAVEGRYAYLAGGAQGLQVVDVSNPASVPPSSARRPTRESTRRPSPPKGVTPSWPSRIAAAGSRF